MIPIDMINGLQPGRKLYRVLAKKSGKKPIAYHVAIAHVDKVTQKRVTFVNNTAATSHGLIQTKGWISENMSISREGAWDQAVADMHKQIDSNRVEISELGEAGAKLMNEYQVIKRKGVR